MTLQSKKSPDPVTPPFLSADEIRATTFVRHVEIHDTLNSTNNRAAELACDPNIELPALVVARHQTAGRGRGANKWWAADGALTCSLLIEPAAHRITTEIWPQLSLTTAVAVCDALQRQLSHLQAQRAGSSPTPAASDPRIKWPNDVLIAGRKIAGILLESPGGATPAKDQLVIGIGMNVNNSWKSAPSDAGPNATALCDITGHTHNLQEVVTDLLRAIERRITQLAANDPHLPATWKQLCWLRDQIVTITNDGRATTGRCLGIADDGALLIRSNGTTERNYSGSVHRE